MLTDEEKRIIELVANTFGMYGGKVLERITHNEEPWKNARKGHSSGLFMAGFVILRSGMMEVMVKKIILMGRSECGKTTLTQALKGEHIEYHKTQYINYFDVIIDTPGEYIQTKQLGYALALYAYEADIVGLLLSATEPYSLYPPNITCMVNREVVGIVTKINEKGANPGKAERWLRLTGCKKIFFVDSKKQQGIPEILEYLREEGDIMPWEKEAAI